MADNRTNTKIRNESFILRKELLQKFLIDDVEIGLQTLCGHTDIEQANLFSLILLEKALKEGLTGNLLKTVLERTIARKLTCKGVPVEDMNRMAKKTSTLSFDRK